MYYSSGNYEAFARPRKPEGVDNKSAHIIGTGLAALTAACYLVRDGQLQGQNILVKVPKNPVEKVIKKIINRKGVSGNSSPKGVKTGLSTHTGLFAGIAAALLAAAAILIKKRRNAKKKPMTLEKF